MWIYGGFDVNGTPRVGFRHPTSRPVLNLFIRPLLGYRGGKLKYPYLIGTLAAEGHCGTIDLQARAEKGCWLVVVAFQAIDSRDIATVCGALLRGPPQNIVCSAHLPIPSLPSLLNQINVVQNRGIVKDSLAKIFPGHVCDIKER